VTESVSTAVQTCRLLYYGAGGVGKRENLGLIHRTIPPESRLAVAVEDPERQIAFTFRQPDAPSWQVLVHSVDAGRERPRVTGMGEKPPFDAVVFCVDSGAAHLDQSLAAFEGLKVYLETWDLDLMDLPVVIQYNRRGAQDALPVDRLESLLNPWGMLAFPAVSASGEGVRETLKAILGLGLNHLVGQLPPSAPQPSPTAPDSGGAGLGLEYGPPVPGSEVAPETAARGQAILDGMSPPVIVPVRIPRRLLQGDAPVRLLLEVQLTDDENL